jgi:5-formyltetrahydrofolate cyclo-ligase
MDQRQSIRHTKHQQRSALSPHQQKIAAQKAADLFSQLSLFTQSLQIGARVEGI